MTAALCSFWNNGESKSALRKRTQEDDGDCFAPKRRRLDPRELLAFSTTGSDSTPITTDECVDNQCSRFVRKRPEVASTWTTSTDTSPKRRRLDLVPHQHNCWLTDGLESSNSSGIRNDHSHTCLLYTSPSPRDLSTSRMPSSA